MNVQATYSWVNNFGIHTQKETIDTEEYFEFLEIFGIMDLTFNHRSNGAGRAPWCFAPWVAAVTCG